MDLIEEKSDMLQAEKDDRKSDKTAPASRYVLITPTRNEEAFIERTIQGIVEQTLKPVRWVIVSDASTDRTDEIVKEYAKIHPFIELVRVEERNGRDFASKVIAFKAGYAGLNGVEYDFLGNLDADIYVEPDYYASILAEFERNEKLGLAGGVRYDLYQGAFKRYGKAANSVGGCVQLYRRACFEETGGFIPVKYGGEDAIAEITARMLGWEVRSFPDRKIFHYRETGAMNRNVLRTRFREGVKDYLIGYHPLFELLRCFYRIKQKRPWFLGAILSVAGYLWAGLKRMDRPVPSEMVQFLRTEQMSRLRSLFKRA
jgi:glycosyltransferase involved in cell wall biosynthesis